jgi:hypothetical protein
MKTNRLLLVMSFATVVLAGTSLYAQQDMDPTYYDPCPQPASVTTTAQVSQHVNQTQHVNQMKTVASLNGMQRGEHHGKRLTSQKAGSGIASDHRSATSAQKRLAAKKVTTSSLKRSDEMMAYPDSPVEEQGEVISARMTTDTTVPNRD